MYKNDVLIGKLLLQMHLQFAWHLQVVSIICWRKVIAVILPMLSFTKTCNCIANWINMI